jgi:L-ascorbate metabolism protein UlaG (beta-lactamase superfamily)
MEIQYLGQSCFKIKGKAASIITDPYKFKESKVKLPSGEVHIVTVSSADIDRDIKEIEGSPLELPGPGEYEVRGVRVLGISTAEKDVKNTVFIYDIDGVSVLHTGNLNRKLTDKEVEAMGDIDILIVPTDKDFVSEVVSMTEASIVIPMYSSKEDLTAFFKKVGKADVSEALPKLSTTKDKLPEETQFIVLQNA